MAVRFSSVLVANGVAFAVATVVALALARWMVPGSYGQVAYFFAAFGMLRVAVGLGLNNTAMRELAAARGRGDHRALNGAFYSILLAKAALSALLLLAFAAMTFVGWGQEPLRLAVLAAAFAVVADFGVDVCAGLERTGRLVTLILSQPVAYAAGVVVVAVLMPSMRWVMAAYVTSFALQVPLTLALAQGHPVRLDGWQWVSRRLLRRMLGFTTAVYVMALLHFAFTSVAVLLLGSSGRFADTARLAVPLSLVTQVGALSFLAVGTVVYPGLVERLARGERGDASRLLRLTLLGLAAPMVALSAVLVAFPGTVLAVLVTSKYEGSAVLLAAVAPLATLYILETVLLYVTMAAERPWLGVGALLVQNATLLGGLGAAAAVTSELLPLAAAYVGATLVGFALLWGIGGALLPHDIRLSRLGLAFAVSVALALVVREAGSALAGGIAAQVGLGTLAGVLALAVSAVALVDQRAWRPALDRSEARGAPVPAKLPSAE